MFAVFVAFALRGLQTHGGPGPVTARLRVPTDLITLRINAPTSSAAPSITQPSTANCIHSSSPGKWQRPIPTSWYTLCTHCIIPLANTTQSKQYLTLHTVDAAHPNASDVFAVAPTSTQLLSASGSSSINVYDTTKPDFPVIQTLEKAHPLGIHHLVTAKEDKARRAATAGFEGKVKIWNQTEDGEWVEGGEITGEYTCRFHGHQRPQTEAHVALAQSTMLRDMQIRTSPVKYGLLR
jgi:uncharacterized protein (DUF2147 family)